MIGLTRSEIGATCALRPETRRIVNCCSQKGNACRDAPIGAPNQRTLLESGIRHCWGWTWERLEEGTARYLRGAGRGSAGG